MAKAIISSILEAQLGKYVAGLRSDSLVVGLWSGELELRDLALKPQALAELQLPVAVASGSVARVLVRVPWNQLGSASVTISLEGVAALVVPDAQRPGAAELRQAKRNQLERRELLRQHRRFAARVGPGRAQPAPSEGEDEGTFVSRLTARIVANLQVTLRDVHLRYEDAVANPETPLACGLMLGRFRYFTTDEEGREAFVDQATGHGPFTYKKAELSRFGMYWDRLDASDRDARLEARADVPRAMRAMVQELGGQQEDSSRRWLLRPCSLAVQLTKNESTDYSAVAKYTVEAEMGALQASLTREQYEDVLFLQRAFLGRKAVEAHFALARGRPLHTPSARPREWWDYATRLVLEQRRAKLRRQAASEQGKEGGAHLPHRRRPHHRKMRWSSVHKALLEQQLYMEAFRAELRNGTPLDPSTRQGKFKQRYEEVYPLDVVLLLRDVAEDAEERAQAKAKASEKEQAKTQAAQGGGGSWYSYFFGGEDEAASASNEAEEEHVLSAEGRENLREAYNDAVEKASDAHEVPMGCNLMSVQLQLTNGSIALYQSNAHESPFVTGMLNGSLAVNIQPENEWDASFRVQHFDILNGLARDSRFHSFCSPSSLLSPSNDPSMSCASIDISRRAVLQAQLQGEDDVEATLKVRVRSAPVRMMVDPSFVMFLHAFFVSLLPEKQLERVWQFATSSVADWMFTDDPEDERKLLESSSTSAEKEAEEAELMRSLETAEGRVAYDVLVDMDAPVLILPENVAEPSGAVVVVDLGRLSFRNDEKVKPIDASLDMALETAGEDPRRLHWRLDITKIHVSLGRQEQLVEWTDEELRSFTKIVKELSIEFSLHTQAASSRLRLPSRTGRKNTETKPLPQVGVYAAVPKISICLVEEQLVALGQIHSAVVAQAVTIAQDNAKRLAYFEEQDNESAEESATESESANDESVNNVSVAPVTVDEKFLLEMELSLGCVELNLRESPAKDAFILRASQTSFSLEAYSAHQAFHARLKALVMEDKLYSPESRYYKLISTGEEGGGEAPHLIAIDVISFQGDRVSRMQPESGQASQLQADVQFNVLHLQWNPSSVALFYRIISAYASAIQSHDDDLPSEDVTSPPNSSRLQPEKKLTGGASMESRVGGEHEEEVSTLTNLRSRGKPLVVVRASLVQFSLTFNKDQLDRQLARLEMSNAAVNFTSYDMEGQSSTDEDTFDVTGHVGNFVGTDLSTSKHPLYSPLLGLDEVEARRRGASGMEPEPLLTFAFVSDPKASDKSSLRLAFKPIRGVYYHQQILELVDFVFEGVLDADEATLQVRFVMENVRIMLFQDGRPDAFVSEDVSPNSIVQRTISGADSDETLRSGAFAEVVASDFSLVFYDEYEKNPRMAVHLGAFSARDLVGNYKPAVGGTEGGTLLVSPRPLEIRYTWDDVALTGELDLAFSEVTGIVIPEALLTLTGFFALPSRPAQTDKKNSSDSMKDLVRSQTPLAPPSPSLLTRRESISDILRDGKEPELTITVRATAKQVGVAVPRDCYDPESPRVAFAGDFTLEFKWKPHPDAKKGKSDGDLDIQSSILADAQNMEIVLENAGRPGCCVASSSSSTKWDAIDVAPLIQLLEPLTLINDCDGCDMGLAQLQVERCHLFLNVTYTAQLEESDGMSSTSFAEPDLSAPPVTITVSGGGNLVVLMSYYNPDTRDWHPMCTEWGLDASVQGSISTASELHVILTASQALDLTVTHGLLEVVASVGGAWQRRATLGATKVQAEEKEDEDVERRKMAPCVIRNETGLPLSFWLTNGSFTTEPQVVSTGSLADVRYLHAPGKGRGVVRRYASGDRDAANLRLCLQLMDSKSSEDSAARFQAVQGLIFEQLGARTFPLVDTHGQRTNFTLSLSAQLVEGRILLVVSSPIKLVNRLASGRPVALLVNDPTWHTPVEIGVLRPNQESAVPVLLSLASELRVRPVENGATHSWSAPIPVQTRSAVELKVEAGVSSTSASRESFGHAGDGRNAVYCVSMSSDKELRTVSFAEPLVLVNKLPVPLTFRLRSAYSSAYGSGASDSPSKPETIAVGAKTSIWWTDIAQRPLFQLLVEGCTTPSKWLELVPRGTASGAVLSVQLTRVDDGRPFRLLLRVVGGDHAARPVRVEILAEVWVINRSGLELVYGTAADSEAYLPPRAARAQVGNAQISAYSSDNSGKVPVVRIGLRGCNWSARFEADPRRLSWQDECITLRSAGSSASSGGVLYELGVSADYATRHFGSVTTLVSIIPRYLILNRSSHTLLLLEAPNRQHQRLEDSSNDNVAHHVLGAGDMYALYWVGGSRAPLRASVLPDDDASGTFCSDGYDWSATFAVDRVATTDLLVPPRASGRGVHLEVVVKRGSLSQATFVVVVTDGGAGSPTSTSSRLSNASSTVSSTARDMVTGPGTAGWQTFSLHAQVAGVIVTVTDKKHGGTLEEPHSLFAGGPEGESEPVARATFTRIGVEASWSPQATAAKLNLMGLKVEDLLPQTKNRVVLRPLLHGDSSSARARMDKYFLELTYLERPHAKYKWVERVHLELQNMKVSTTMSFVDRLNQLQKETTAHFQHKSLVSAFPSEDGSNYEDDEEGDLLAYFVPQNEDGDDGISAADMAAMTGRKLYIASGEISPARVVVSFTRDKTDSNQCSNEGFWLSNLKLKIENACVTLEGYRLTHALATQESLTAAIVRFYEQSVKSQALGLIESIEVTSLVTSMVAGGVTSLVSTLRGKADPAAAAGAMAPGMLTSSSSSVDGDSPQGVPFRYEHMSNGEIVRKHSKALGECRSSAEFLRQVRHLVYDWDANHTGLEARGCVALALINNSRHSLVVNTQLNDGASLRVLPLGRRHLASVLDVPTDSGTASAGGGSATAWRADRAVVVFAYGYTPTLLTSGDVYFTVQSNACSVYATRKTARLRANRGYTATFTLQETQSWWSANVVIIGDDLLASESSVSASDSDSLFGETPALAGQDAEAAGGDDEFEVEFSGAALGIIAKQSGRLVIVRECVPSSAAQASGRIAPGDCILAVNGVSVANTSQFKQLVSKTPRPIVLRFRRSGRHANAAYDLFGESKQQEGASNLFG
ncbi:Vacuolar protein sorting-associated protein [Phytophthora cinnamomi]|uniref:Vacuolar protein sorting-associated protein n=1 Tax=Phytophthora cinnamomi TaxID=4785 RepID=UPI00355A4B23|nr:Vacuolar protein sorting-associated protein [Phytophthora cinnamomi]